MNEDVADYKVQTKLNPWTPQNQFEHDARLKVQCRCKRRSILERGAYVV